LDDYRINPVPVLPFFSKEKEYGFTDSAVALDYMPGPMIHCGSVYLI
jgi:hypothetical protein